MKRRTKIILLVIVVVIVVFFIGMSNTIGQQVFLASTQLVTNDETRGVADGFWEKHGIDYESFSDNYQVEKLEISSTYDEHRIPADYIYATESENSKDHQTVILVHGLGDNRYGNYPIAKFFLERGYNVVTYDQRSTNENTAKYTTFGYWEKYDLIDWINFVEEQAPGQTIGIWGASFGGATAGLALGYENTDDKVEFAILDCPVSSMKWMVEEEMRKMEIGLPISYMTLCGNIINKSKLGFSYEDADVATAMKSVSTPVLIINSKVDSVTPYFMGKDIYDSITGNEKELWTLEDSQHCEMWLDYNQEYCDKLQSFLEKHE